MEKKKSVGNETVKSSNIFLHIFASVEKLKAGETTLHFSVSGEQKEKVKSIKMPILILDAKSFLF